MKTHELGKALAQLGKILQSGPNIELSDIHLQSIEDTNNKSKDALAVNLVTLLEFSRIEKKQWVALVRENNFPVTIDARDSSRNILGKVLRYLEANPEAADALKKNTSKRTNNTSPALMEALSALLKGGQ